MPTAWLIIAALFCSAASVMAQASVDWTAKETAMWQAIKDKKLEPFSAGLDSAYVGVWDDGLHDRDTEVAGVRQDNLKDFRLSDLTVRRLDPHIVLLTYKSVVSDSGSTDFSATYWVASVWQLRGGRWRVVMHTAHKAP